MRRSILALGLARTTRCEWTAAASHDSSGKRSKFIRLSFARIRSQTGLNVPQGASHTMCAARPSMGQRLNRMRY